MSTKTYTHAGVSRLNGEMKFRVANDSMRVKVLQKNLHKDIDIIELKHAMTKDEAVAFLLSIDFATRDGVTNQDVQNALVAEQGRRAEKPVKAPKAAKVPKTKAAPTMEGIKAKVAAKKSVPKSTVTREEVKAQLDAEFDNAPF